MKPNRLWQGVRLRTVPAAADPDGAPRDVSLPAAWEDEAAAAIAALAGGERAVSLPLLAEGWVRALSADATVQDALHRLLMSRRAAPCAEVWAGAGGVVAFKLNLAGFAEAGLGLDLAGLVEGLLVLRRVAGVVGPTGLDDMLAVLGLDYDSVAAREIAASVAALIGGALGGAVRAPARGEALPGFGEAWASVGAAPVPVAAPRFALLPPGPEDALLGVETVGIAPAFAAVTADGALRRAAQARLAARGMPAEAALALAWRGEAVLALAGEAAARAMAEAMAPWLEGAAAPVVASRGGVPREELPGRRSGYTQKAAVGGHRLYVTTGEYADGRLGEVAVSLSKESPVVRGLMDSFAAAISVGLQHGVPLRAFVEALAGTSFGPAGAVEGDPHVAAATSLPDYVVRTLAATYLGETLPEPVVEEPPALPLLGGGGPRLRVVA